MTNLHTATCKAKHYRTSLSTSEVSVVATLRGLTCPTPLVSLRDDLIIRYFTHRVPRLMIMKTVVMYLCYFFLSLLSFIPVRI